MSFQHFLKRLLVVLACLAGSAPVPFFAFFALKDVARFGAWGLLVVGLWFSALLALLVMSIAWALDKRLGRSTAVSACVLGSLAFFAYPLVAAFARGDHWLSELRGALGVELLVTLPATLLASHVASYHAKNVGASREVLDCGPRSDLKFAGKT